MTFKICIPFWIDIDDADSSTRLRNVKFVDYELTKMMSYLQQKGLNITYTIYDFSPENVLPGATHQSFPLAEFRKSEKWNFIINDTRSDMIIGLDSDMFIHEADYDPFYDKMINAGPDDIFLFNCRCIWDADVNKVDWVGHDTSNMINMNMHKYMSEGHTGSFGGLWVCPTKFLKNIGGFNENLRWRGHEDGEILTRITKEFKEKVRLNRVHEFIPIHLPHAYHFSDERYHNPERNQLNGGNWEPRKQWD